MELKLHNTLTGKKEPFTPIDAEHIRMYVCGPTVYARPHIGNARSVVVYDVLFRLLKHLYPKVTYARNITDVDDKINVAATERGITIQALTEEVTGWFHDDMDALNCERPTIEPKATEHITQIITMIEQLIENGNAYVGSDGQHVLFDVTSYDDYGHLSGRKVEDQEAGARIAVGDYKKHPGDFVLWKPAAEADDESSKFASPWGIGRPGWHIECSAMSTEYLGETFDIHGGGADLKFPHHENEIAQSCCANPKSEFAKYWVHNGFLTVDGEKMSKSLGNFVSVRDLLDDITHGEEIRWALLSAHYSKPLNWTEELLGRAKEELSSFAHAVFYECPDPRHKDYESNWKMYREDPEALTWKPDTEAVELLECFFKSLGDDLNIPNAKVYMHKAVKVMNKYADSPFKSISFKWAIRQMTNFLGIASENWKGAMIRTKARPAEEEADIQTQINARIAAKANKDFATSDRIRDELKEQGIILEDRPDGTTGWRRG